MKKYWDRLTSSARGEMFNPLLWPFLLCTLAYSVGFAFFQHARTVYSTPLFESMVKVEPHVPLVWGIIGLLVVIGGMTFLLFNIPPFGKLSGLVGFMLWSVVFVSYVTNDMWLLVCSIAIPNMYFWVWQYLSLMRFRKEDAEDESDTVAQSQRRAGAQRKSLRKSDLLVDTVSFVC